MAALTVPQRLGRVEKSIDRLVGILPEIEELQRANTNLRAKVSQLAEDKKILEGWLLKRKRERDEWMERYAILSLQLMRAPK